MTLADLTRGQWGVVEMVSAEAVLRQRLFDLGLVPGTLQVRFIGRKGNLAAYYVRGSVLALRRSTAQQVLIRSRGFQMKSSYLVALAGNLTLARVRVQCLTD